MFQTFNSQADISFASKHLPLLRAEMQKLNIDGFLVPHDDEYLNEYLPDNAERLMWVSGFTGSAGAALILKDRAIIFVDGRYTLQVRDQVDAAHYDFVDMADWHGGWFTKNDVDGLNIGYDPYLFGQNSIDVIMSAGQANGARFTSLQTNPIDQAWADRPNDPASKIMPHALEFSGQNSSDKRQQIAKRLNELGADTVLLTAPHSLAWAFNIRGGDVHATPLPLGRGLIFNDGSAKLFFKSEKVTEELRAHLDDDVTIFEENAILDHLTDLGNAKKTVLIDPAISPVGFTHHLQQAGANIKHAQDPCAILRASKNDTEIEGSRQAHIRDGAAVTKFLHWVATEGQSGDKTEIEAAQKLEECRRESNLLNDISFDTISAAGANGAHCHYRVTEETNATLESNSLYLVDSGGQYNDGTTDITRTMAIGQATDEMKRCYTLVLQGHINLSLARFPAGTTGHALDSLARLPLWKAGLDYDHGTGHGVGSYLGVHEGPQNISKYNANTQPLVPGMICSNEPGYYKTGEFGIRIENLVVVTEAADVENGERPMMGFENLTFAPLARNLIVKEMLSDEELAWVNDYHAAVFEKLSPLLNQELTSWLQSETSPL